MLSRLHLRHLLRRFSSLQIPNSISPLTHATLRNAAGDHGATTARTTRAEAHRRRGLPQVVHHRKNHRKSLCSRASEAEEVVSADPLFAPYLSARIRCRKGDAICITSIFADGEDVHSCILRAKNSIGLNYLPTYEVLKGEQSDWLADVQKSFHPIEVTDGLWIVPKWKSPPDSDATSIILDPGMAFGTGEHPTTKLCLLLLSRLIKGGEHFLDYGTGSGILGIAALKMGAALSVGLDIDPLAVTSARQNIALNQIDASRMSVHLITRKVNSFVLGRRQDGHLDEQNSFSSELDSSKEKFDIVVANILLNPLIELAEGITVYAKPGGAIGVSGILSEQVQEAKEHYSRYLMNISVSEMDGWACLFGTRR